MPETNKTTLKQLLTEYFLVIPDYQRGYAQGRDNPRDINVLDMFIETISETLRKDDSSLSFDYVYGNIREENGVKIFYPVDGQQRLTTLFLFYVYCYQKNENKDFLSHFRYSVHPDTNSFIKLLIKNGSHEPELLNQNGSLKPESVEVWKEWLGIMSLLHTDPCVSALFNAYRKIELKLKGIKPESYINKLEAITFQFLDTKKNNLSDSVFWKMNARGRQLTESEVFKAGVIKNFDEPGKKENFAQSFSSFYTKIFSDLVKIGHDAADNTSEIDGGGIISRVDKIIMRVIKSYCQWMTSENEFKLTEPVASEKYWKKVFDKNDDISVAFPRFFQFYSSHNIGEFLPARACAGVKNYLLEALSVNVIPAMILFFRLMDPETPDVEERFRYWMRVSLNLIDNSQNIAALKSVLNTLSDREHMASIETAAVFDDIKFDEKDATLTEQLKEERLKAVLLSDDSGNKWREPIENAENLEILDGKISVLLDINGAKESSEKFKEYADCLAKLWNHCKESEKNTGTMFSQTLLPYYTKDLPETGKWIPVKFTGPEVAKDMLYNSMAGTFSKYAYDIVNGKPRREASDDSPYWIRALCGEYGEKLIKAICSDNTGFISTYMGRLPVLWSKYGCTWHSYNNVVLSVRNEYISKLLTTEEFELTNMVHNKIFTESNEELPYFKEWEILLTAGKRYHFRTEDWIPEKIFLLDEEYKEIPDTGSHYCVNIKDSQSAIEEAKNVIEKATKDGFTL